MIELVVCVMILAHLTLYAGISAKDLARAGEMADGNHLKELELRLKRLLQRSPYRYNATGKPDPFRPFNQATVKSGKTFNRKRDDEAKGEVVRPRVCSTPLECLDVGQLTLVGVVEIEGNGRRIAMAQDSSGIGYIIKVGDRIGFNHGRVTAILPDRVVVTEMVEGIEGNRMPRKRVLLLHPEEQK